MIPKLLLPPHTNAIKAPSADCEQEKTGIACNWKIYAGSLHNQNTIDRYYSQSIFNDLQTSGNFDAEHTKRLTGYTNGPRDMYDNIFKQDTKACTSASGPKLDKETALDHITILYDTRDKRFKDNAQQAYEVLTQQHPAATIVMQPVDDRDDVQSGLGQQAAYLDLHDDKKNVAVYYSGHGINSSGNTLQKDGDDWQGQLGMDKDAPYLTEKELETYMGEQSDEITSGFVIIDACGSGAFADND